MTNRLGCTDRRGTIFMALDVASVRPWEITFTGGHACDGPKAQASRQAHCSMRQDIDSAHSSPYPERADTFRGTR